jgi:hypothetical protein
MLSLMLSLASNLSLRRHSTTHWPQDKTATMNSEHRPTAREANGPWHHCLHLLRHVCWKTSAVRSSSKWNLQLQVFQSVYDLSHPGKKATAKLVAQHFMWPGIQKDCQACQRSKSIPLHWEISHHQQPVFFMST